ncbi:hypothetical protein LTR10_014613 [Elasticomyces elasticus]|nr:hypothetical protein LTR10_014613 [Elasticomyces elasticus]KAK5040590.1 hypothetical protein LTS07_001090 [Exophiala sideris]KAK5042985.1 hypothetical protein LTR13_000755 [Exophiala sideris]
MSTLRIRAVALASLLVGLFYFFGLRAAAGQKDIYFTRKNNESWTPPNITDLDEAKMGSFDTVISAIMDPAEKSFDRLSCPPPIHERYDHLRQSRSEGNRTTLTAIRYFFALNLYQSAHPERCVLSIVGGRSNDGTTEILEGLRKHIEATGATYYFSTSNIDPLAPGHDRITDLAHLRNLALDPLVQQPQLYSTDATVIFINDVAICLDDILELIHQRVVQQADMVCAMDWVRDARIFYDSWVARNIQGDLFVEVPQTGSFDLAHNVFWNHPASRARLDAKLPTQVYACWNGGVAFIAKPLIQKNIRFRASHEHECIAGEPTLFCKDFWRHGHGRIAIVPSVNLGYSDDEARTAKELHGYTADNIRKAEEDQRLTSNIHWKSTPPELVKCQPDWLTSSWVEWNEAQVETVPLASG